MLTGRLAARIRQQRQCLRLGVITRSLRSPSPRPKSLPYSNGVVASPGAVVAQVGRAEALIASAQAVEQKVLGKAEFESLGDIYPHAPGVLDADCIWRPGVKRLGDGFAEEKRLLPPDHEATQLALSERAHFEQAGKHVAGEQATGRIDASITAGIARAQVGVDLIVGGSKIELRVPPERVLRKKEFVRILHDRVLGFVLVLCSQRSDERRAYDQQQQQPFHFASGCVIGKFER